MATRISWKQWWQKWSNFTDKQKEAERLVDNYDYTLFGAAAGPGKSYFLRKYPIKFLIETCWHKLGLKGVRAALFCEDFPSLWDRHISRLKYEFPTWLGEYKGQTHEFVLDDKYGGGTLCFRNLDDPSKYMSSEFALEEVDELTKNKKETFDFLRLRKRWVGIERTKFVAGTNPGGIGHGWVRKIWIDREFEPGEQEKDQFVLLRALANDNPHLPKNYVIALEGLPEKMRKAYLEGNWDTFSGQYFTEWNYEKHTCYPFPIPDNWKKFRAYDHGREAPASCKWYALDYDGRCWCYREFYKSGLNIDQIAEEISRLSGNERYEWSVADPSIFAKHGFVDKSGGETIAQVFSRHGIQFIPGSNRRIDGWNLMHQYLHWGKGNPPKLIFFNTCYNAIKTIPNLIHDEHKPEDLDSAGEDHSADDTRYFLMALHERKTPKPITETEQRIRDLYQEPSLDLNSFYAGDEYRKSYGK